MQAVHDPVPDEPGPLPAGAEPPGDPLEGRTAPEATDVVEGSAASDDDGQALLAKHTVVRIVGNNRTKQAYVGLQAVVKRAVGLGGWHWLTLANGEEIKLQRNALLVLSHPTGDEQDSSGDEEHSAPSPPAFPPPPPAAPVAGSPASERRASRYGGSAAAAAAAAAARTGTDSGAQEQGGPIPDDLLLSGRRELGESAQARIDLRELDAGALRRYRQHYRLPDPGPNPDRLLLSVAEHFRSQQVDELGVLSSFLAAARRRRLGSPQG